MTDRTAPVAHPINALMQARWSPRAFTGAPVTAAQEASLLEAARWAASCFNEQPWVFITARKDAEPEAFARLAGLLSVNNQAWAPQAGLLMIAFHRTTFAANGAANAVAMYDLGQAVAQMALQAVELGLGSHQMRGFDVERARGELGVPEGHEPVVAIAFGVTGAPSLLPEKLAEREVAPRVRKPIGEFAHVGQYGTPVKV
ncbi:nitroreductase family protein [Falsiroseomonas sp.]|uniref:nitroreductase family protein n=1 Tax=Falsiroseomonas sp. TaxID=2870721 RepID=UPI00271D3190|nr:nitroreductase family protein [Falsiroseomonas sp.]MDO9502219.1 nitroreductase family protein [Falsiroseomonas sp.]